MTLVSIQLGNKSAAWFAANPTLVLLSGQIVYLDDQSGTYKKGDGTTQLSGLSFLGGTASTPTLQQVLTAGQVATTTIETTGFIKTGGTSSQFLKADGSVDSSSYQPSDADLTSWALITRASGFDTFVTTPSSLNLYGLLTTKTGTLNAVFSDSPVFTTTIFANRVTGGTGVNDGVDFVSTTGAGTSSSAAFNFKGGTNGGTMILTALNDGTLRIPNNRQFQGVDSGGTNRTIFTWSASDNLTFTGRPGSTDIVFNPTSSGVGMYIKSSGDVGIGSASPSARCHIIKTTEQLRVGYDTSNYFSAIVGSGGAVTLNAVGAGAKFSFSDNIELTQTVTTEALTSDRSVTIVINGITYKLLAKA